MTEPSGQGTLAAAALAPYLCRWEGPAGRQLWPLSDGPVTVGRSPSADIVLDDPMVSRVHSTLDRVAGVWTVTDNGLSRNGTYVNARRVVGRVQLHDRDALRVGDTVLTFCAPSEVDADRTLVGAPLLAAARLTPAQLGVLVALCRPCGQERTCATPATNQQIAAELFLSVDAVKTHLRQLFHKLGIDHLAQNEKRARLAELALLHGLVPSSRR